MRYISLFSGIEAASVAWEPLGWEPVCFCEIDAFPSAVLAERYPHVPNLGDITKVDWKEVLDEYGPVDIVVGGSPCQSFSIAGSRESLRGESALCFEYYRAVRDIAPRWFLWENVPGVFSTRDNAFGQFLGKMEELGYSMAWRTLDAQFFGVAQRRRRVFLVGHIGDGFAPAAVLFEPESVPGNTQSSREKRQELARAAGRGAASGGFKFHQGARAGSIGYETEQSPSLTADYHNHACLCLQTDHLSQNGTNVSDNICKTLDIASQTPVVCLQDGSQLSNGGDVVGTLCSADGPKGVTGQSFDEGKIVCQRVEPAGREGSPRCSASNGEDVVSALCASDWKGVGSQYVTDGKVVCQPMTLRVSQKI